MVVSFRPGLYASSFAAAPLSGVDVLLLSEERRIDFFGVALLLTDRVKAEASAVFELETGVARSYGLMTM